ncbi:hypothetical protein F0U62_27430 [Cystobacter fuscus]|uniref:endonuclease/exonuclease/phosphatase family protein n=1 Tax=Cystobacter fuscus TaxID=43 RepID=UPI002B2C2DBD|nr:hypothetical protein F0U62_27430 [Cystobacter fuscus]
MKYILAVGISMMVLGAFQVSTLPRTADPREESASAVLFVPGALTVMTRSLGTELSGERVLQAPHVAYVPTRAAELFGRQPDASSRARALADEVQYARPHLIGLQQVTELRLQSPGDALFGGTEPARTPYLDPLPLLLGELEARGLHYREVARVRNTDVEVPLRRGQGLTFDDLRLTDFDVILARSDVTVSQVRTGNYLARREVKLPRMAPVELTRGWVSVAAEVEGQHYRFVSTHLEPAPGEEGLRVQLAQAEELIGSLRGETLPVVLVGDFNSPANLGLVGAPTYRELLLAGYVDVWTRRLGGALASGGGLTLGMTAMEERLNLVLVRTPVSPAPRQLGPVLAYGVGELHERRRFGPWRTDLSGVVARLRMPVSARN